MWESLARYEWLLMGLLIIGLAGIELRSVSRSIERDKAPKEPVSPANPPGDPPPPAG